MKPSRLLITVLAILFSSSAMADSIYCGTHIIDESKNKTQVLESCGEPDSKQQEQWFYERGEESGVLIHFAADASINRIKEQTA